MCPRGGDGDEWKGPARTPRPHQACGAGPSVGHTEQKACPAPSLRLMSDRTCWGVGWAPGGQEGSPGSRRCAGRRLLPEAPMAACLLEAEGRKSPSKRLKCQLPSARAQNRCQAALRRGHRQCCLPFPPRPPPRPGPPRLELASQSNYARPGPGEQVPITASHLPSNGGRGLRPRATEVGARCPSPLQGQDEGRAEQSTLEEARAGRARTEAGGCS